MFLAKSFDNVSFSFICKERNLTVHLIARWADLLNWIGSVPIYNLSLLLAQALDRDGHRPSLIVYLLFLLTNRVFIQPKKKKKYVLRAKNCKINMVSCSSLGIGTSFQLLKLDLKVSSSPGSEIGTIFPLT